MPRNSITFTADELRTIIWMCESAYAAKVRRGLRTSKTSQRILAISRKASRALIQKTHRA